MALLQVRLTDGTTIAFNDAPIGSGGEKTVFFTADRQQVVSFYHGHLNDRPERRRRLEKILNQFNVTASGANAAFWASHFCWPTGIIDSETGIPESFIAAHQLVRPLLGLVSPAYRRNFFFRDRTGSIREKDGKWFTGKKARRLLPDDERGTFLGYLQVCTRMARAVRRLHFAGLAHSDLSNKNVLIDPRLGDACVIDIDSLVVPQVAPPSVIGTPGYIAPEVLASGGTVLPSIATDKHALAVLIYETLLQRHPLRGKKSYNADPTVDEELSMGKYALFIEHPTNRGNPPEEPITFPASRLGAPLYQLIIKTFVDGLHEPGKRADAAEWERALYQTLNMVSPLPSGSDWMIVAPGLPLVSPISGERFVQPVPYAKFLHESRGALVDDKQTLTIWHNQWIQSWHVFTNVKAGENADKKPLGYFSFHEGQWWAVNNSGHAWAVLGGSAVENGKGMIIQPGLQVKLAPGEEGRVLSFDVLKP